MMMPRWIAFAPCHRMRSYWEFNRWCCDAENEQHSFSEHEDQNGGTERLRMD